MTKNPRLIDLTGQKFGRWNVRVQAGNTPRGAALWRCVCECGTERAVLGADLRKGKSLSCGCYEYELTSLRTRTHGGSRTRLHQIWKNMRRRCSSPNLPGYQHYGGRGIAVCAAWSDFAVFRDWAMTNGYADDLSIERVDVNGNYSPENCTWATAAVQSANRRFVAVAPDGELWWHKAKRNGLTSGAYRSRLYEGWPIELAATLPMHSRLSR